MQDFIQAIADEHVYLFDGAMGTMLYSKGVFINKCYDELNLRSPEIVLEVHKQYVRSDAEILETNTYGANRVKLRTFGIEEDLREINLRRWRLRGRLLAMRCTSPARSDLSASASSLTVRPHSTKRANTSANRPRRCSRAASIFSS